MNICRRGHEYDPEKGQCKDCARITNRIATKRYRLRNKEERKVKDKAKRSSPELNKPLRSAQLQYNHKISLEKLESLISEQGGLCLVCGKPLDLNANRTAMSVVIDHKHNMGCCKKEHSCDACRRGILHRICNSGLGLFGDDPKQLRMAAEYLEGYNAKLSQALIQL